MSTSRHIDKICVLVTVLSLLAAVLFLHGGALGITAVAAEDENASAVFTDSDLNGDWDTSGATQITLTGDGAKITGNGAYAVEGDVHIVYAGKYVITGTLSDGSIIIDADGDDKIRLLFENVSLNCSDSAALIVEQADKVFLTLADGSENTITSGSAYGESAEADGIDGAVYSRDDLTINGSGSLTVSGAYKHGIVANDDLVITGGTIAVTAAKDAIRAHDSFRFANAALTITAGDDGIHVENDDGSDYLYAESGTILVTECYEGIESTVITVAGGEIEVHSSDDGFNSQSLTHITGGIVRILNESGRDADGIDSNGDIIIDGGYVFVSLTGSDGGNCALDFGTERGGTCVINGGTVIACGGSSMAEELSGESAQASLFYFPAATAAAGTTLTLTAADGTVLIDETIPYAFSAAVLSAPELSVGETVTVTVGDASEEVALEAVNASNRAMSAMGTFGGRGGMGGGMQGGMQGGSPALFLLGRIDGGAALAAELEALGLTESIPADPTELTAWLQGLIDDGTLSDEYAAAVQSLTEMLANGFGGRGGMGRRGSQTAQTGENGETAAPPEGMTPPDFSGENGEMPAPPEGMTPPDFTGENGEMPAPPEGMTPPDFTGENGEMPTPPDSTGTDGEAAQSMRGNRGGSSDQPTQSEDESTVSVQSLLLLGGCAAALLAGIAFALRFKREGER